MIVLLVMLAQKLKIAYPIILVIGGLGLRFVPGLPHISIDPQLIFFLISPPLLFEAAWQTSWKEFWKWRRVITSFAFGVVILTSCLVAYVSTAIIPGFTVALGFLLGAIISPPDAVQASLSFFLVILMGVLIGLAIGALYTSKDQIYKKVM